MSIRAVIFDLDDTLYDCTGLLVEAARLRAAKAMVEAGLPCTPGEAYRKQLELEDQLGPRGRVFERLADLYGLGREAVDRALDAYNSDEVDEIELFPDVVPTIHELRSRGIKVFLVTGGVHRRQEIKIRVLGLESLCDAILINDIERGTLFEECYEQLLREHDLQGDEVLCVGDRLHVEIKAANTLGLITCQMLHGRYSGLQPRGELEEPAYRIERVAQVLDIVDMLRHYHHRRSPRVVVVGGGTGLPIVLDGLKAFSRELTAIVTVTDNGRSSGRLRSDLGVLPPGDLRNCLVALSNSERLLHDLFQYRFDGGALDGMSFGNLLIAALAKVTGSFEQAIREVGRVLAIEGRVLPATLADTHLCAELADGTIVGDEVGVRRPGKLPLKRVFLRDPGVEAFEEAREAIEAADLVALGPGSLYTSVIANLLVPGIARAIRRSRARRIYICNVMTQPGQTDGYAASDHVRAVLEYLDAALDAVVVNTGTPPAEVLGRYAAEGAELVRVDPPLARLGPEIIEADLVEDGGRRRVPWEKQDLLRHNPQKIASILTRQIGRHGA
ncbi:MAG: YvcK family protein [Candidatus Brocadiia bacterium]